MKILPKQNILKIRTVYEIQLKYLKLQSGKIGIKSQRNRIQFMKVTFQIIFHLSILFHSLIPLPPFKKKGVVFLNFFFYNTWHRNRIALQYHEGSKVPLYVVGSNISTYLPLKCTYVYQECSITSNVCSRNKQFNNWSEGNFT